MSGFHLTMIIPRCHVPIKDLCERMFIQPLDLRENIDDLVYYYNIILLLMITHVYVWI